MRLALLLGTAAFLPFMSHAGWREEVVRPGAGPFPAPPDLTARYVFGWSGIEAAEAEVTLRRTGGKAWCGSGRGGRTVAVDRPARSRLQRAIKVWPDRGRTANPPGRGICLCLPGGRVATVPP